MINIKNNVFSITSDTLFLPSLSPVSHLERTQAVSPGKPLDIQDRKSGRLIFILHQTTKFHFQRLTSSLISNHHLWLFLSQLPHSKVTNLIFSNSHPSSPHPSVSAMQQLQGKPLTKPGRESNLQSKPTFPHFCEPSQPSGIFALPFLAITSQYLETCSSQSSQ